MKKHLEEYDVYTVIELGLSGVKNGDLMKYCVAQNFDILLSIDKNLIFQQNLEKYPVTIVILNSNTSKVEELITFLPSLQKQIHLFQNHQAYTIDK